MKRTFSLESINAVAMNVSYLTISGMALDYAVFFIFLITYLSSRKFVSILTIFFLSRQMRRCAEPARNDLVAPFFIASSLMSFF